MHTPKKKYMSIAVLAQMSSDDEIIVVGAPPSDGSAAPAAVVDASDDDIFIAGADHTVVAAPKKSRAKAVLRHGFFRVGGGDPLYFWTDCIWWRPFLQDG